MKADGNYLIITWDLNTTGRRLTDEICHIGAYYKSGDDQEHSFSQYVMPHKNPDQGAVQRYHLQVSNFGRYRVLMDTETGTYLKTKSEYTALSGFMDWLQSCSAGTDGVILVYHEPARYILVPLLLDALNKYKFVPRFKEIVKGFSNGVSIVDAYGDKEKITSNSLRSLSKTVLNDTNPQTTSTLDRSSVLYKIITHVSQHKELSLVNAASSVASSIEDEEEKLSSLKAMLNKQKTLRPIFQFLLVQKPFVRQQAVSLRKILVDAGMDYESLETLYKEENNEVEKVTTALKKRLDEKGDEESVTKLIDILNGHFISSPKEGHSSANKKSESKSKSSSSDTTNAAAASSTKNETSSSGSSSNDATTTNNNNSEDPETNA